MLKAFFDDSGTHDTSPVIVMGGLIADEADWIGLEAEWLALRNALGIRKMRMSDCEGARGDFGKFDRDARDRAIAGFREIIIKAQPLMLISAVSRASWDDATARSDLLRIHATPLDLLFNNCMQKAMRWRPSAERDSVVATFDSRDQNLPVWKRLGSGYEQRYPENLAGFAFSNMERVLPLQAADMIAYEGFRHMCERVKLDCEPTPRSNFSELMDRIPNRAGFFSADSLVRYANAVVEEAKRRS